MAVDVLRSLTRRCGVFWLVAGCLMATADGARTAAPADLVRYLWYDLDTPRAVWLDTLLVAKISAHPSASAVRRALRLSGTRLVATRQRAAYGARRLPVFRPGPSALAAAYVLTPAIIVYLDPEWSPAAAAAWLAGRELTVIRRLRVRRNAFLIQSTPGLATLHQANALYESGEVVAAFPDWWRAYALR